MKGFRQAASLFCCGAAGYAVLELLWRRRTHWTMALTGGTVFVGLARIGERLRGFSLPRRCAAGSALITTAELVVGATVNLHYQMRVWDYSHERFNFKGQICAKYAALWYLLSAPAMALAATISGVYETEKAARRNG